jgi:hypothetical protein
MLPLVDKQRYKPDSGYISQSAPLLSSQNSGFSSTRVSSSFLDNNGRFPEYLRRLCDIRQMDFESAFDQMITLVSLEPQKV